MSRDLRVITSVTGGSHWSVTPPMPTIAALRRHVLHQLGHAFKVQNDTFFSSRLKWVPPFETTYFYSVNTMLNNTFNT